MQELQSIIEAAFETREGLPVFSACSREADANHADREGWPFR